jgi:hypothetical protein
MSTSTSSLMDSKENLHLKNTHYGSLTNGHMQHHNNEEENKPLECILKVVSANSLKDANSKDIT